MHEFRDSPKQREILRLVLEAADRGSFISQKELRAALSYGPDVTSQALQCSMRFLEKHGMIERRTRARERIYVPTPKTYQRYRGM